MQFTTEKKSSVLLREAINKLLNKEVIVLGGGFPKRGTVQSVRVHQRRVWATVSTNLGTFTFPAEVIELV